MKYGFYTQRLILLLMILSAGACKKSSDDDQITETTVTDADGNVYKAVSIGSQVWMTENLKTTHYSNGDSIPHSVDSAGFENLSSGACTFYNDNAANSANYGRLYNWHAVNDPRGLAPAGWHIPTDAEWQELIDHLGGTAVAGGKMKSSDLWLSPNADASNSSRFSAVPGGYRHYNGRCTGMGEQAYWWSATERNDDNQYAYYYTLFYNYAVANQNNNHKEDLMSIRCVKN